MGHNKTGAALHDRVNCFLDYLLRFRIDRRSRFIQDKQAGVGNDCPGKADELYEILRKVEIPQLWDMGQKGRELILKRHTLKLFGDKYKALYENVLADPSHLHQID